MQNVVAATVEPCELSLPSLTGTPKQIAWAEDIRRQWRAEFDLARRSLARDREKGNLNDVEYVTACQALARLERDQGARADAVDWIETRSATHTHAAELGGLLSQVATVVRSAHPGTGPSGIGPRRPQPGERTARVTCVHLHLDHL